MLFASKIIWQIMSLKLQSSKRGDTAECEANRIVTMAAKIKSERKSMIRAHIQLMKILQTSKRIPHHLQTLLKTLVISGETKQFWACNSAIISTSLCHNTNTVWGRC